MARAAEGSLRDGLSLLEQARAYCGAEYYGRSKSANCSASFPKKRSDELDRPPSGSNPPNAFWAWFTVS